MRIELVATTTSGVEIVRSEIALVASEVIVHWPCRRSLMRRRLNLVTIHLALWASRSSISRLLLVILLELPASLVRLENY